MKRYQCDMCMDEPLNRDDIIVFKPPTHDSDRGATTMHLCLRCIPTDMDITTS